MGTAAATTPVFVARQPIFDGRREVFGYELLFRSSHENRYEAVDGDKSTLDVIARSFVDIGVDELTGGRRGFINFTRGLLLAEVIDLLPPDLVTVEILEDIEPDDEVLAACRRLKDAGYMLAMDDFVLGHSDSPLLEFADIVKVDFMRTTPEERARIAEDLARRRIVPLAEKVETEDEFCEAAAAGFVYFQGYFFSRPSVRLGVAISASKLAHLRMMREMNRPELSYDALEEVIKQDVPLTYKLLRFINSAWFGLRHKITSVKHALVWLGPKEIRKWYYLVSLRDIGTDKPNELFVQAMTRAKLGEGLAEPVGLKANASDLFLMGMFSLIDVLLDAPMAEILDKLPLDQQVKAALVGQPCQFRQVHDAVVSYERGDWDAFCSHAGDLHLNTDVVPTIFRQSLKWANQAFEVVRD